jgi:hypothetical protein
MEIPYGLRMAIRIWIESLPVDNLILTAYQTCPTTQRMLAALRDPEIRRWPKDIRKYLQIAMQDCEIHNNQIYYRKKLYLPPNDKLKLHIVYRTYSTGPGGHPGRVKTLDLINRTYWWPGIAKYIRTFV